MHHRSAQLLRLSGMLWLLLVGGLWCDAAAAAIVIKFEIAGGTPQMENNLRAFLSLSRYADRKDLDADTIARLQTRIPNEAREALQPLGYYEAQVSAVVTPDHDNWQVTIKVNPGPAVLLTEVNINVTGEGENDSHITVILNKQELRVGSQLDHGVYERVKSNLLLAATNNGYLEAHWLQSDLLIDQQQHGASVTLRLDTGPRYYFGAITISQDVLNDDLMQRLLRMKTGDPYSLDAVLQSQYVFDDSQYFLPAEIASGVPDPTTHTVPITVSAKANHRDSYTISAGYATDTRARGKLTWTNRLVNREGHRMKVELTGSAVGYEAAVHYIIPVGDVSLEKVEFTLADTKQDLNTATSYRNEFITGLTQVLGSWQRVLFTRLSQERSEYAATPTIAASEAKTFLIIPGISYATLPTHILGQAERRYTLYMELNGSPSSLGSGASYLQLILQGERIFDLNERWHLRLRSQLGFTSTNDFLKVPVSSRFFAGGDNSVRGFGLNELAPTNSDGTTGGRYLLVGTVEVERDLPRNFRWATFYDIGNAINKLDDRLQYSVGVGLRWHVSVASMGLDVAQPLSVSDRWPRLHLHISTLF